MSTETTHKKIEINDGTTYGNVYTDKAVDELLKGIGSKFQITKLFTALITLGGDYQVGDEITSKDYVINPAERIPLCTRSPKIRINGVIFVLSINTRDEPSGQPGVNKIRVSAVCVKGGTVSGGVNYQVDVAGLKPIA